VNKTPNAAPAPGGGMVLVPPRATPAMRDAMAPYMPSHSRDMADSAWRAGVAAAPTSAATPAIVVPPGLIYALRHQRQVDEDGTECGVSRQAVDEAIVILEKVAASRVRHSCETDLLSDCPACSADADAAIAASDDSAATPGGQGWNVGESVAAWLLHRFGPDTPEGKEATLLLQWASTLTKPAASAAPGAVDALPAKWRGEAFDIAGQRGPGDEMAQAFQVCADELTAALAHPQPDGPRAGGEP
jgi:hypothetical protein